uniref:ShKT domain-containing protein n=1 Tax=Caenorhabditis japonica TaxID=281687 RepID=A0A8R1HJW4_CAEJA
MKSKCEASCGFCGIQSFEEAEKVERKMRELTNGQDCDLPRKCVFPKEKMLNSTANSMTPGAILIDPIIGYKVLRNDTTTSRSEFSNGTFNTTAVDLKTVLIQSTVTTKPSELKSQVTTSSRQPRTISTVDPNESLKTFAASRSESTTSSITLPRNFNSTTTFRKITLEELKSARDTMPKITTAEPSSLTTSLSKTVIQGTCFDEYTYCREFTSLCSHPAFSEVMASHCSLTCDRCEDVERVEEGKENCEDKTPDCSEYRDLCENSRYKSLMENYCPKTCGHCVPLCRDRHQNCPQFYDDGFCNDTMYTVDERKYLCGATCLMC